MSRLEDDFQGQGLRNAVMDPFNFLGALFGHMFKTDDNPLSQGLYNLGGEEGWNRPDGSPMQITPGSTQSGNMENGLFGLLPGFGGVRQMLEQKQQRVPIGTSGGGGGIQSPLEGFGQLAQMYAQRQNGRPSSFGKKF